MNKIEIGSGGRSRKGFIGIDIVQLPGVEIVADVDKEGIPLLDNSVEHLYSSHTFEHFVNFDFVMSEVWRVCKHEALIELKTPYLTNTVSLSNPFHKTHLTEYTFLFYGDQRIKLPKEIGGYGLQHGTANEQTPVRFRQEKVEYIYNPPWHAKSDKEKDFARRHYLNVVRDIHFILRPIKE